MKSLALLTLAAVLSCKGNSATAAPAGQAAQALKPGAAAVKPSKGPAAAPLVSRNKKVQSSKRGTNADALVDGSYKSNTWAAGRPTKEKPSWVAIDVGPGPTKLLLNWTASGSFNHNETTYGGPGPYRIEVSADSDDGEDGTWKTVAEVAENSVRGRTHAFDFAGQRWVRWSVLGPSKQTYEYGVQPDEVDLHDVSAGADETFFFLGDSITAFAFDRADAHQPSVAALLAKAHPGHFPVMVNGGIGFEKAADGLKRLPGLLADNAALKYWCIGYGTNDAAGNGTDTSGFEKDLEAIIALLKKEGRVPVLARIPFAPQEHDGVPKFNEVIDALTKKHGLIKGPDLYAHFKAHPEELSDGLHPNDAGIRSINRLWAEALEALYR